MNILNQDYYELMKDFRERSNLQEELTDNDCICYSNMFVVLSDITNNTFSFDEMLQIYDFATDVIDGKHPDIMLVHDKYRDIYKLLKRYSITKKLNEETLKKVAFLIYQAKCILVMDEETNEPTWNMGIFEKGTQKFLEEYEDSIKEFPSKFTVSIPFSDPTKEDYGLSLYNPVVVSSIEAEYQYLGLLLTSDNKKISYNRVGSLMNKDGIVDEYKIYVKKLLGKKEIATIYISGYGLENTLNVPRGFRLMTEEELKSLLEK